MKEKLLTPDDTLYRENIICPYCGHIQTNREEYESGTVDCGGCEEAFELNVEVSVTYSTYRLDEE